VLPPEQEPRAHHALASHINGASVVQVKALRNQLAHLGRHLDRAGLGGLLHPGGRIHRIAPDVVKEFALSDDAGHNRAGSDTNPHRHCAALGVD
jgi:hypothetical protein